MGNLQQFLEDAGQVLADGFVTFEEAKAFFDEVTLILNAGTDPTDADWAMLHAYEKKQLDILNAKMEGE